MSAFSDFGRRCKRPSRKTDEAPRRVVSGENVVRLPAQNVSEGGLHFEAARATGHMSLNRREQMISSDMLKEFSAFVQEHFKS